MRFNLTLQQFLQVVTMLTGVDLTPLGLIYVPASGDVILQRGGRAQLAIASSDGTALGVPISEILSLVLNDGEERLEFVLSDGEITLIGEPKSRRAKRFLATCGALSHAATVHARETDLELLETELRAANRHGKRARQMELRRTGHTRADRSLRYRFAAPNTAG